MAKKTKENTNSKDTDQRDEKVSRQDDLQEDLKSDLKTETGGRSNSDVLDENKDNVIDFETIKNKKDNESGKLEETLKEIEDLKSTVQRTQADFLNFKRRTEEEKDKVKAFANECIIMDLLEVIDNFDRALSQENCADESFFKGVALIKKQILDILEKNHVKEIDNQMDFDPNFHHAVMQEEGDKSDEILEVFQKGYLLKDKVIRPSMVKVSK